MYNNELLIPHIIISVLKHSAYYFQLAWTFRVLLVFVVHIMDYVNIFAYTLGPCPPIEPINDALVTIPISLIWIKFHGSSCFQKLNLK